MSIFRFILRKTLCVFFILVLITFSSCENPDKNNYILNDLSGIVVDGEKYIPIDIYSFGIDVVSYKERLGDFHMQYWTLFDSSGKPDVVDAEIPLISTSPFMPESYYCPENRYNECVEYIQNLSWDDKLALQTEKDHIFSEEFSYYILHEASHDFSTVVYKSESNTLKLKRIVQLDTTGSFCRYIGEIIVRAEGDSYFLPAGYEYIMAKDFNPTGSEYDQIAQQLLEQRIPDDFVGELLQVGD